jgi:hypothetical protein
MPVTVVVPPGPLLWQGPAAPGSFVMPGLHAWSAVMTWFWLYWMPTPATNLMYSPACQVAEKLPPTLMYCRGVGAL